MVVGQNTLGNRTFATINGVIMLVIMFITLYPFWYAVVGSFNEGVDYLRGGVNFWPRTWAMQNYRAVFSTNEILAAYRVSVARTVLATVVHLFVVSTFAYAFSRRNLVFRNVYAAMGLIGLFFQSGVIPEYFVLRSLGLLNTFWVYVFPPAFNFFSVIIFASFFRELPASLHESARIDGARELTVFARIVVPLSKPVFAAIALFTAVWNWNDYRMSLIFTTDESLKVVQLFLLQVINSTRRATDMGSAQAAAASAGGGNRTVSITVQLATMVITATPILIIYPFLQKYFVKGVLIGSIKG